MRACYLGWSTYMLIWLWPVPHPRRRRRASGLRRAGGRTWPRACLPCASRAAWTTARRGWARTTGCRGSPTAGRFLAPAGKYFPGLAREVEDDQLPDAAEEELRASGGEWAKVIGDTPLGADRLTRTFSDEAIAEAARRVHAAGGRIAVHCSVPEVIQDAIDAGFDSLEHASLLQADQLAIAALAQ